MNQQQSQLDQVLAWLQDLPTKLNSPQLIAIPASSAKRAQDPPPEDRPHKRQRQIQPTPPPSTRMATSPSKRSRRDSNETPSLDPSVDGDDDDRTPKSKKSNPHPVWGWGRASSTTSSRASGNISPKKQARAFANATTSTRQLTVGADVPTTLKTMWRDIGQYNRGVRTICSTEKAAIETAQKSIPEFELDTFPDFYYDDRTDTPVAQDAGEGGAQTSLGVTPSVAQFANPYGRLASMTGTNPSSAARQQEAIVPRTSLGITPSVDEVLELFQGCLYCRDQQMDELGWNTLAHQKILELALGKPYKRELVTFAPCTSAAILPPLADIAGRKVDFCVTIRPDAISELAIKDIRAQDMIANLSINHTDFPCFQNQPIALSIETKIPGDGLRTAEEQLLSWHSAQWRMLERLVRRPEKRGPEPESDLPEFLPGIIVQGHDWLFVATTKIGDQVTLWTSQHIGSTTRVTGVYQIVAVLQYLKRWIENTYWPWYKRAVLRLREPVQAGGASVGSEALDDTASM